MWDQQSALEYIVDGCGKGLILVFKICKERKDIHQNIGNQSLSLIYGFFYCFSFCLLNFQQRTCISLLQSGKIPLLTLFILGNKRIYYLLQKNFYISIMLQINKIYQSYFLENKA